MVKNSKLLVVLASALLLLAACGENDNTATKNSQEVQDTATESASSTEDTTTPETKSEEQTSTKSSQTATKEDTVTEAAEKNTTTASTNTESSNEKETVTNEKSNINPVHKDFIQNQVKTAKHGMTEGVPFESGKSVFEDITSAWGEPTTKFSNDTNYIEYAENGSVKYAFAIGRGDRVYDVRTFVAPDNSFNLSDITFDEIIAIAGQPTSIKNTGNDKILNYTTGENTLKFVGPSSSNKLDHISIFNQASSEPMGGRN